MALSTLSKLAESADSESVRRQAAKDIMSLGGFDIQRTEDLTDKVDTRTDEELLDAILDNETLADALTARMAARRGETA